MKFDSISKEFLVTAEQTNLNIFLTWVAWSWKSTLIDYYKSHTNKKYVLLGTTGTAAINIWWMTIHRFFWIWKNWQRRHLDRQKHELIKTLDIIFIDETSMLRSDLFDLLDEILRDATWIDKPFWWKQMIFIWDLLQIPPVLVQFRKDKDWKKEETEEYLEFIEKYSWRFFFNAHAYDKKIFKTINLQKVYRQDNQELINHLNLVRAWIKSEKVLSLFNSRITPEKDLNPKAIYVWSSNSIVEKINKKKLKENKNPDILLSASIKWEFEQPDYPVDRYINVKLDCRVMFTSNHPDQLYSNWTLWTLEEFKNWYLYIRLDNWDLINLNRMLWENITWYDDFGIKIVSWTFAQFPLKAAHAITIHKSQWKTFDNVIIDTWYWCFESWMLYVALSRATSLEWIQLVKRLKLSDIKSDLDVKNFLEDK
jgi:hypothetical protein